MQFQLHFQPHYHLLTLLAGSTFYNPGYGSAPSDLTSKVYPLMDIMAWCATSACIVGIAIVATMMAISHHRGTGSEHFASLGRVLGACVLIGLAGPLVQFLA
jgi:peptidoglycan/LPS O-acetylase OafA/YrhL